MTTPGEPGGSTDCEIGHRGPICGTCWLCPACCPGLPNCALLIAAEVAAVAFTGSYQAAAERN